MKKKNVTQHLSDSDQEEDYVESELDSATDSDGIMFQEGDDGGI